MTIDDDYDPSKPEYIVVATADEIAEIRTKLMKQQQARLEAAIYSRQKHVRCSRVLRHYRHVNRLWKSEILASSTCQGSNEEKQVVEREKCCPFHVSCFPLQEV